MSPKIPANVLRRFFIVSSPSSGPPVGPSWACCEELRLKNERARDPAVAVIGCEPSSVGRRLRNGLPPPRTSRDVWCVNGGFVCCCWGAADTGPADAADVPDKAGLSFVNVGGTAELLRSISGESGRLVLVIEWRDWVFVIDGAGPAVTPGGRHWVYIIKHRKNKQNTIEK